MILAAGLGTRLRPLTLERPKPLAPVGDRPMLAHVAGALAAGGVRRAVVNTHHLPEAFTAEVLAALALEVAVVHEPALLGTAGGLANARELLGPGDVVVWNGDILADLDVGALVRAHAAKGAQATLAVAPRPRGEGTVGVGVRGEVVRLRGEVFGEEAEGGDFVGVHVVGEGLRARLPAVGCIVGDVYMPWLREGGRLETLTVGADFEDVGTVRAYLEANARWLERRGSASFVGAGARVATGVELESSVVGEGAVVEGRGFVRRAVIWPGARATAPLDDVVVTTEGRVAGGA